MAPRSGQRWSGLILLGLLAVPASIAATTPAQQQGLLEARKEWTVSSYNRRLALLRTHRTCVNAAQSQEALKNCRRQAKQAKRQLRTDRLARMNAVRRDLGLPERTGKPSRKAKLRKQQRRAARASQA